MVHFGYCRSNRDFPIFQLFIVFLQIQAIVYETHSKVSQENEDMLDFVITEMNNYATEKFMLTTATSKQVIIIIIRLFCNNSKHNTMN